jgi:hypothetical protein
MIAQHQVIEEQRAEAEQQTRKTEASAHSMGGTPIDLGVGLVSSARNETLRLRRPKADSTRNMFQKMLGITSLISNQAHQPPSTPDP